MEFFTRDTFIDGDNRWQLYNWAYFALRHLVKEYYYIVVAEVP
jgi:hypothetical protein